MELRWLAGGGPAAAAAEANARHGRALWAARSAEEEEMLAQVLEENRQLRSSEAELAERAAEVQRQLCLEAQEQEDLRSPQDVVQREAEAEQRLEHLEERAALVRAVVEEAARLGHQEAALVRGTGCRAPPREAWEAEVGQWWEEHEALEERCAGLQAEASGHLGVAMRSLAAHLCSRADEMRSYALHLEEGSAGGSSSSTAPVETEEQESAAALEEVEALRRGSAEREAACASHAAAELESLGASASVRAEEVATVEGDSRWLELEAEQAEIRARLQEQAKGLEARLAEVNEEVSALSSSTFGEWSEAELASYCEEYRLDIGRRQAADFRLALCAHASRTRMSEADAQAAQEDFLSVVMAAWSEEACEARVASFEEETQTYEAQSRDEASEIHACEMEVAQMNLQVLAATRYGERLRDEAQRATDGAELEEAELEACEAALADEQRAQHELAVRNSEVLEEVIRLRRQHFEDLPAVRALAGAEDELRRSRAGLEESEELLEGEQREEQAELTACGRRAASEEAEVRALEEEEAALRADVAEGQRENEALQRGLSDLEGELERRSARDGQQRREEESKAEDLLLSLRNGCVLRRERGAALATAADAGAEKGAAAVARLCALAAEIAGLRAEGRELDARVQASVAEDREAEAKHRMDVANVTAALGLAEAQLEQFHSEAEAGQEALEHAERQRAEAFEAAEAEEAAGASVGDEAEVAAAQELEELSTAIAREEALLEEDRQLERAGEARAGAEVVTRAEAAPASLEACWRVVAALELSAAGQAVPAEIEDDAVSAMRELDPEALVGFLLACSAKPLCEGALLSGLAAALREHAEQLGPLALATASRSLAVLSALDVATHEAIVRASSGEEFELVE